LDIRIQAKNIDLNPDTENYIHKKLDRLERHMSPISSIRVEISRGASKGQGKSIVAQITLSVGKYTLRGQDSGVNVYAAVDGVTDVVDRQIRRFKGKVYHSGQLRRRGADVGAAEASAVDQADLASQEETVEELGSVVRTKRFPMTPMAVDDAIFQMELLSHGFFLFFNMDSNEYNVAYRRQDGDYGVIEPELT
jgi:putative sigma-54 modulation protein